MTKFGLGAAIAGTVLAAGGWLFAWPAIAVLGLGIVAVVIVAAAHVVRRPRLAVARQIEPPRVEKGAMAIAVVRTSNLSRRTLPALVVEQQLGDVPIRIVLPRLRRGEAGTRTYRLPTSSRGVFAVAPLEVVRADPFGLFRAVQHLDEPQRITVHPRLLTLAPLPSGHSSNLEGPSSDMSPQGSITFHRLREYVVGDDLRSVHWPSTARTGTLVVRHNVDTAQPFTVVLIDLRPSVYSAETFEEAVDVTASVVSSMSGGRAPVQLRTSHGERIGGLAQRHPRPLIDYLTEITPVTEGDLGSELLLLRRDRGGTALVVVTGRLEPESLRTVGALRRRFDRLIVASVVPRTAPAPAFPGVTVLTATTADELARAWNREAGVR